MTVSPRLVRAAEAVAGQLLATTGVSTAVPVDPDAVASALVVQIVPADLQESGRLVPTGSGPAILVNRSDPLPRRRFTVAHELAHLALLNPKVGGAAGADAARVFRSEEAFCDAVAGALLMPRRFMVARFGDMPERIGVLRELVNLACVSWTAGVVRLHETCRWTRPLLELRRSPRGWHIDAEAGLPRGCPPLTLHPEARWGLDQRNALGRWSGRIDLEVRCGASPATVGADAEVRGGWASMLLDAPRGRQHFAAVQVPARRHLRVA